MRRGTPASEKFGHFIWQVRTGNGMTMAQVAERTGEFPSSISNYEKAHRAVKEEKVSVLARALEIDEAYFMERWLDAQRNGEPPIVHKNRRVALDQKDLDELISMLTAVERSRVHGYVEAILEDREKGGS